MRAEQRVRTVVNWLIFREIANNDRELAEMLGYTKASFSQIVNGKVPLSDKFVRKLCSLDNINEEWVKSGVGEMFKENVSISQIVGRNSGVINNNVGNGGGNNTTTTNNTTNNYSDCEKCDNSLLGKALDEIAEQRKLVSRAQDQIDRLITLLGNK